LNTRIIAAAATVALALTACGGSDGDGGATDPTETETGASGTGEIAITGVDFAFEGVPDRAETGATLTFTNASDVEAHELVLMRIADGEERSIEELLELPDEEAQQIAEFVGVSVAMPGEDGTIMEGSLELTEPGRYALLCFIPVGADPEVLAGAMESESTEPPDMGDGPPHFTRGMAAELTVDG
jgi:hypothetical protein